jgi:hypothetical protein
VERGGVRIGLTLTPHRTTSPSPPYTPIARTLVVAGLTDHSGCRLGRHGLGRAPLWDSLISVASPISFKETDQLLLLFIYFFYFISLQFKISLLLNLNLVLIPANPCNLVEYLCNIVMIKLYVSIMTSVILHLNLFFLQSYDRIHYLANFEILAE